MFYGGVGPDVFFGQFGADVYVFDNAVGGNFNFDVVGDFGGNPGGNFDRIRVFVNNPSAITTIEQLQTALGVEFLKEQYTLRFTTSGGDDPNIDNLYIRQLGTEIILMEIEDFYQNDDERPVTLSMFDIHSTAEKPTAGWHIIDVNEDLGSARGGEERSLLALRSLAPARVSIVGDAGADHSDLFELIYTEGSRDGNYTLRLKEGARLVHDTHGTIGLTLYFSKTTHILGRATASVDAQRVEIRVQDALSDSNLVQVNGRYLHDDGDSEFSLSATDYTDAEWFDLGGGNDGTSAMPFSSGAGSDFVVAGSGDDVIRGGADNDVLYGGAGGDDLEGNDGADRIYGGLGDDHIEGGAGNDVIFGGAGDERDIAFPQLNSSAIFPSPGSERGLYGGTGDDKIYGGAGEDVIYGGTASDTVSGGNDILFGGAGIDNVGGGYGNDYVYGGAGADRVFGGAGDDFVYGGAGDDEFIRGGIGDDVLYGGAGDDDISGQDDDDILIGGAGDDIYDGGSGADWYHLDYTGKSGKDAIVVDAFLPGQGDKIYVVVDQDSYDRIGDFSDPLEFLGLTRAIENVEIRVFGQLMPTPSTVLQKDGTDIFVIEDYTTALTYDDFEIVLAGAADDYATGIVGNPEHISNFDHGDLLILAESIGRGETARFIQRIEFENADADSFELAQVSAADGTALDTRFEIRKIGTETSGFWYELWLSEGAIIHYEATDGLISVAIREKDGADTLGYQSVTVGVRDVQTETDITGSNDADGLYGDAGDNDISGLDRDDILYGGAGDDAIDGGADNDILSGGAGRDTLTGGAGDDGFVLDLTASDSTEADFVTDFTHGEDYIIVDVATDDLSLRPYSFTLADATDASRKFDLDEERLTNDIIKIIKGTTIIMELDIAGGTGDIEYQVRYNYGSAGRDSPVGSNRDDVIQGHGSRDLLRGAGGDDFIILTGDNSASGIYGQQGDDVLYGADGGDDIYGEDITIRYDASLIGNNIIYGAGGHDNLYAGAGNDIIYGGAGNDEIIATAGGNNIIYGGAGDDEILGGAGDDHHLLNRDQAYVEGDVNAVGLFRSSGDDRILIYVTAEERAAFNAAVGDRAKLAALGLEVSIETVSVFTHTIITRISDGVKLMRLGSFTNFDTSMLKLINEDLAPFRVIQIDEDVGGFHRHSGTAFRGDWC